MSLQGVLSDFGVSDVFQLIAQQRKTGVLEIENEARVLGVYFREGEVVRARPAETRPDGALAEFLLRTGAIPEPALAEAQRSQQQTLQPLPELLAQSGALPREETERVLRLLTHETIFELFLWEQGRFRFNPQDLAAELGDEAVGAEAVLLDALRMRDEWTQICARIPDLSAAVSPTGDLEELRARGADVESACSLSAGEVERLFTLADGRRSARRMIDLSRLGTFLGAKGLLELAKAGLVRVEARSASIAQPAAPVRKGERSSLGLWALALGALAAVGLASLPRPPSGDFPVPLDGLATGRASAEAERVELALEAHRWTAGQYPESLDALAGSPAARLLPDAGAGYLYARSSGGYRLRARR